MVIYRGPTANKRTNHELISAGPTNGPLSLRSFSATKKSPTASTSRAALRPNINRRHRISKFAARRARVVRTAMLTTISRVSERHIRLRSQPTGCQHPLIHALSTTVGDKTTCWKSADGEPKVNQLKREDCVTATLHYA